MNFPSELTTQRLHLRWLNLDDAAFIFELVNDPDWISYIGDKDIGKLADAQEYLRHGPIQMYQTCGFGLNCVLLKDTDVAIGICGILKRDHFEYPDLGFAFLPRFRANGYAYEACKAVINNAANCGHKKLQAIVQPINLKSTKLLEKLGFQPENQLHAEANESKTALYQIVL